MSSAFLADPLGQQFTYIPQNTFFWLLPISILRFHPPNLNRGKTVVDSNNLAAAEPSHHLERVYPHRRL